MAIIIFSLTVVSAFFFSDFLNFIMNFISRYANTAQRSLLKGEQKSSYLWGGWISFRFFLLLTMFHINSWISLGINDFCFCVRGVKEKTSDFLTWKNCKFGTDTLNRIETNDITSLTDSYYSTVKADDDHDNFEWHISYFHGSVTWWQLLKLHGYMKLV